LSFPFAFKEAGLITAILIYLGLTGIMGFSLHAIVYATVEAQKKDRGIHSYQDLVLAVMGKKTATFLEAVIVIHMYLCCIGFFIIIGDTLTPIAIQYLPSGSLFASRMVIISIAGLLVCMPLCMVRELFMLRHASFLVVASVFYMVLMIMGEELDHQNDAPKQVEFFVEGSGVFISIPLMCFALSCHIPTPLIYTEMHHSIKSIRCWDTVLIGAYTICCACYIPAGIFGYYTFGSGTISDLLSTSDGPTKIPNSYPVSDKFVLVARICLAAVATCAVPLKHFPARTAVQSLCNKIVQAVSVWGYTNYS
jgi:sodium-coupled neutral amino acid transporter 11